MVRMILTYKYRVKDDDGMSRSNAKSPTICLSETAT